MGIVDGLEAALLQIADLQDAVVRENPEDTTQTLADGGTLAPHAIQVIVEGGADADIAAAIWDKRTLGCTMVGSVVVSITDTQGTPHDVKFDRAADEDVYVKVHSPAALTMDQQTAIAQAIQDRGDGLLVYPGGNAIPGSKIGVASTSPTSTTRSRGCARRRCPASRSARSTLARLPARRPTPRSRSPFDQRPWLAAHVTFTSP